MMSGFAGHYVDWRSRRIIAILEHYGPSFFKDKTVLEVGAGFGDIGNVFAMLGADVTASDGRWLNVLRMRRRYPNLKCEVLDISKPNAITKSYDIILHLGVLYHLPDHEEPLRDACEHCQYLILETEVCDSDDALKTLRMDESGWDQSLQGHGCRPSPANVERVLKDAKMEFELLTTDVCNSSFHVYDWPITNSGEFRNGLRRLWFCQKAAEA